MTILDNDVVFANMKLKCLVVGVGLPAGDVVEGSLRGALTAIPAGCEGAIDKMFGVS